MINLANPRQTVLVTCREYITKRFSGTDEEKDNIIAIDWHSPLSFKPMMYGISVSKDRFSYKLIHESKVFVVNFMSKNNEKEVLFCGRNTGEHMDKFKESGLTAEDAESVECYRIKEALAYIECKVIKEVETGDHVIIIGEVSNHSGNSNLKDRLFHVAKDKFTTTID